MVTRVYTLMGHDSTCTPGTYRCGESRLTAWLCTRVHADLRDPAGTVRLASVGIGVEALDPDTRGASARTTVEGSLSRVIDEWVTPDFVFVLFRIDVQRARVT